MRLENYNHTQSVFQNKKQEVNQITAELYVKGERKQPESVKLELTAEFDLFLFYTVE